MTNLGCDIATRFFYYFLNKSIPVIMEHQAHLKILDKVPYILNHIDDWRLYINVVLKYFYGQLEVTFYNDLISFTCTVILMIF